MPPTSRRRSRKCASRNIARRRATCSSRGPAESKQASRTTTGFRLRRLSSNTTTRKTMPITFTACGAISTATSVWIFWRSTIRPVINSKNPGTDLASHVILRKMSVEDIPAGLLLCRASRWNQLEEDWRVFLQSQDSGAFLAEKEGRAVGTAAFLRYGSFAWIAMMLVDPEERRAGIGTQLMEHVLSAVEDAACAGLDATPAGEPLYRRFGFVAENALV